ncbi:MAG: 5'-nucleotidase C-terminal domain-containing protein [Gemmatimonadales bacterium]
MFSLLFLALQAPADSVRRPDTVEIVVVATTDIHGHVYHWDYLADREAPWGLTRAATLVDSIRRAHPGRVVVVDAGDIIQGNPFATYFALHRPIEPHPVIDAMNGVGYDAAVVGNHEFNFGLDVLARAERSAAFPLLGANVFVLPRDTVLFRPFVTVTRAGLRVAIAGFTTPGAMVWDRAHLSQRLRVAPVESVARATLDAMAASGAALRLVVIHSGMDGPSSYDTTGVGEENVAATLATLPVSPHLVVVGHSHGTMPDSSWRGVHFMQPAPWAREIAIAHILVARDTTGAATVLSIRSENRSLAEVPPDPAMVRRLQSAHDETRTWVDRPVAETPETWTSHWGRVEDVPLVDLVNEIQRRATGADLSSAAVFNPQARFGPGPIRLRDVAAVYPYENTLRAVRIDGARLRAYLEQSAAYFGQWGTDEPVVNPAIPGYNYDIVSGVEYVVDLSRPVGQRIVQLTHGGQLVTAADTFTLALNSYRQSGGGGFAMLQGLPVVYDRGENVPDLLLQAVQEAGILREATWFTPSWRILPVEAREAVRAAFPAPVATAPRPADTARVVPEVERPQVAPALPGPAAIPPLARVRVPLAGTGVEESRLGNLVADAVRNAGRADIGLVPQALLRGGLAAGDVYAADIGRVVADTGMVTGIVEGSVILALLEAAVTGSAPAVAVSGLRVRWEPGRARDRIREVRLLNDQRLESNRTYLVAAPVGVIVALTERAGTLAEALAAYLPRMPQPVEPPAVGRWDRRP